MDLRVYEKTRYQNIYRHKKNKNYLIMISKPIKSSISSIDGEKIYRLEEALKIRDNPKIKMKKKAEVIYKDDFDSLWNKYVDYCKYESKLSYNTLKSKDKVYKLYLKSNMPRITHLTKEYIAKYIDSINTTNKQKNAILKQLKAFFNWCLKEEIILSNPVAFIKKYKEEKEEMKYWQPSDVKRFFSYINNHLEEEMYYTIKIFVLLTFTLSDRIGETRALTYNSINKRKQEILINHSINYDSNSSDFLSSTKTYNSVRSIDVPIKVIEEIDGYRYYLINNKGYDVKEDSLIIFNHHTQRPYSDSTLRFNFHKISKEANVPYIRLYDLRHTSATILLNYENVDMWAVSNRLGHKDIKTTIKSYNHITKKIRKEIAEVTTKYI